MRIKTLFVVLVKASVLASLFFIFSASSILAQKDKEQTAAPEKALETLRKYETAGKFYDTLQAKEPDWQVLEFSPPYSTDASLKSFRLSLKKGVSKVIILIYEYETVQKAIEFSVLKIHVNAREEKYNRYGEEGQKIYGNKGFSSLAYRKNRFVFSIHCQDEEVANRFAGYFSASISQ